MTIDGTLTLKQSEPTHDQMIPGSGVLYVQDGELHYKGKRLTGEIITKRLVP